MTDIAYMLIGWAIGMPLGLAISIVLISTFGKWGRK